jgi:hypothetical protein
MPIRAQHRGLYPFDWQQLSYAVRFKRAHGRCEHCGRPHGLWVLHLGDGRWWDPQRQTWRSGQGRELKRAPSLVLTMLRSTRVVLSCAHLNHDPTENSGNNLKALCQRCHLLHDRPEHLRRRAITYRSRRALGDLFSGPYGNS